MGANATRWLRLEDAARETEDIWLRAELLSRGGDVPGIYVNDAGTAYKVFYTALERERGGGLRARQRTRTFRRDDDHELDGEHVDALTAAVDFKSRRDAEVLARREAVRPLTLDDAFELYEGTRPLRASTASVYRYVYDRHIAPALGSWELRSLDVEAVERWHRQLDAKPEAKAKAARLLRSLTAFAFKRGLMPNDPGRALVVSGSTVRALAPDEVPTAEQVAALAREVGDKYRALVLLLAYGGLRIGEAVALRVDRIDWERRRITVDASATEVGGRLTFGPPKTAAARRTFTAPRFLIDALREHVERFPTETGLVFSNPRGGPLRPGNFRRRVFDPAVERAGLRGLTMHDLRHTAASTLAAHGASATEIAARLGHSNAAVTQRVYMHMLGPRDERLAELQDEAWAAETPVPGSESDSEDRSLAFEVKGRPRRSAPSEGL